MRSLYVVVLFPLVTGATLWGSLALYYAPLPSFGLRASLAVLFPLLTLLGFIYLSRRDLTLLAYTGVLLAIIYMYFDQQPSHHRHWQEDVAVMPRTTRHDDGSVTIHGVRNNRYQSASLYEPVFENRRYDLAGLQTLDLFLSYWGSEAIAHVILSFGFSDGRYLSISIETRKTEDEEYSAIRGFFRQYELIYVVADERDVIRLRTNFRDEVVYLYRLVLRPQTVRRIFLTYLDRIDELYLQPAFYNALLSNCATNVVVNASPENSLWEHLDWRILLSGYMDRLAYQLALIDNRLPFEKFRTFSRINDEAQGLGDAPNFSQRIREAIPMPLELKQILAEEAE